jgi:hypothetical protein
MQGVLLNNSSLSTERSMDKDRQRKREQERKIYKEECKECWSNLVIMKLVLICVSLIIITVSKQ